MNCKSDWNDRAKLTEWFHTAHRRIDRAEERRHKLAPIFQTVFIPVIERTTQEERLAKPTPASHVKGELNLKGDMQYAPKGLDLSKLSDEQFAQRDALVRAAEASA